MHHFWERIAYIANTLIFILSGTVIAEGILASQDQIEGTQLMGRATNDSDFEVMAAGRETAMLGDHQESILWQLVGKKKQETTS
ncbi:unnamed protein product [Calypogeia fissa]